MPQRSTRERRKKDRHPGGGAPKKRVAPRQTGRSGAHRSRRSRTRPADQRRARAALRVELTIRVADGSQKDHKKVQIVGRSPGRSAQVRPSDRLAAARRIAARCRPGDLAGLLMAVAHPQRIAMMTYLLGTEANHRSLAKRTGLKAGPLYYHIRQLRGAGLIGPRVRDLYALTRKGRRVLLGLLAIERLNRSR